MTNNLEIIRPMLVFPDEDNFYFVQIIQRKKDHKGETLGGSNNNSRLIRAYYITSDDHLMKHWPEMVRLAEVFNARVSINLNPRSFQKTAFGVLQKIANQMANGDFRSIQNAYNSVCGEYQSEIDKRWLIDLDEDQVKYADDILSFIHSEHEKLRDHKKAFRYTVLGTIPSKSGLHIITNPFNMTKWQWPEVEIHKNNPTNLYIP